MGDPAVVPGTRKVHTGDIVQLYATGLGVAPAGTLLSAIIPFSSPIVVTIGNSNATVFGAAQVYPGQWQINIQIPNLAPGIYPITIQVAGQTSQSGVMVPAQ